MLPKILAVAAALALSPAVHAGEEADAACSYSFDVTRAMEAAPGGCPVATWRGGGYDARLLDAIPASEGAPAPALPVLAQLWTAP
jgi:hypothetical protein